MSTKGEEKCYCAKSQNETAMKTCQVDRLPPKNGDIEINALVDWWATGYIWILDEEIWGTRARFEVEEEGSGVSEPVHGPNRVVESCIKGI